MRISITENEKQKKLFWYETCTGSQKELVFGSRVTRLSGTSRAYVLLGSVISALFMVPYIKCDICGPSFQLKAVIVNIAIHN